MNMNPRPGPRRRRPRPRPRSLAESITRTRTTTMRAGMILFIILQLVALSTPAQFTAITNGPVVTDHGDSTGCAWADYDKDGKLDLFVSNFGTPFNYLYHNNGDGTFTRVINSTIATTGTNCAGDAWGQ